MPRYDYKCPDCEITMEITHPIDEYASRPCPECNFLMVKQISAPATHFKGGGWGGSYPGRSYRARAHGDVGTGEVGSQTIEEIGPAIKKPGK